MSELVEDPRVKLEFRKVLGRISDGLALEDVKGLKNLCYDHVTERKREEIDTGIQLFNVLIERGSYPSIKLNREARGAPIGAPGDV